MKCPKTLHPESVVGNSEQWVFEDCLKEMCAWWEQDLSLCACKDIALELRYIQLRLADIIEKRPSKGEGDPQ